MRADVIEQKVMTLGDVLDKAEWSDDQDRGIVMVRFAKLLRDGTPQVGDWIDYPNDVRRRISHIWPASEGYPMQFQTSDGGSWYMGDGYVSFSGSLFVSMPGSTLTASDEWRDGHVWIFHHDHHQADNSKTTQIPFRVWRCSDDARTY